MKNGVEAWKFLGCKYLIRAVWKENRPKQEKVQWHRFLWRPMVVPKHVFISWIAILNCLPTMDRLASWGMQVRGVCYLCQEEMQFLKGYMEAHFAVVWPAQGGWRMERRTTMGSDEDKRQSFDLNYFEHCLESMHLPCIA